MFKLVSSCAKFCYRDTFFATGITGTFISKSIFSSLLFSSLSSSIGTRQDSQCRSLRQVGQAFLASILANRLLEQCETIHIVWSRSTATGCGTFSKGCCSVLTFLQTKSYCPLLPASLYFVSGPGARVSPASLTFFCKNVHGSACYSSRRYSQLRMASSLFEICASSRTSRTGLSHFPRAHL